MKTLVWLLTCPAPTAPRNLVVPNLKGAEQLSFREFWDAYNDIVKRGRNGALTIETSAAPLFR